MGLSKVISTLIWGISRYKYRYLDGIGLRVIGYRIQGSRFGADFRAVVGPWGAVLRGSRLWDFRAWSFVISAFSAEPRLKAEPQVERSLGLA